MRSAAILTVATLMLISCNAPDVANRTEADKVTFTPPPIDQPASVPAPAPAAPVTADAAAIPSAFQGVYDEDLGACSTPSQARLEIRSGELRFHESIGTVRKVAIAAQDRISVTADYQGEGESWQSVRELRLSDGGATLAVSGDGTSMVRRRCPPS